MVVEPIVNEKIWRRRKEEFLKRLQEDEEIGYLDADVKDILLMFFKREKSFTISSCSGRIVLVDSPMPWMRDPSSVVFKKHSPISVEEVRPIIDGPVVWRLWLVVTGPIIHVSTLDLDEAVEVLEIAREAGLKHSGILSLSSKGIIVELMSGVRLTILLRDRDVRVVGNDKLGEVVSVANEALLEGKKRLDALRDALRRHAVT